MADHKRKGRGRPVNRTTRLGRMIDERDMKAYQVAGKSGVNTRLLVEYTNGRRVILPEHAKALAKVLDCKPQDIIEPNLKENLTDVRGYPLDKTLKSAKMVDMSHLETPPRKAPVTPHAHTPNVAPERLIRKAV